MNKQPEPNRWWENYLVRYLMPSIAGAVIVSWLGSRPGSQLKDLLYLPTAGKGLDTATLTLLFLYGNLFCYVASYPVLCFHVTRVVDFRAGKWPAKFLVDGYISTFLLAVAAFACSGLASGQIRSRLAFLLVVLFSAVQLYRIHAALSPRIKVRGLAGAVSPAYGFSYALARRRGIPEESEETTATTPHVLRGEHDDRDVFTTQRHIHWRPELIATYRHLREHGNSAFIFVQELILAALVYCVTAKPANPGDDQLGNIGILFAVWAVPAVFVHLIGQHLERRFSKFDEDRVQ